MEVLDAVPNRAKAKRRKAYVRGVNRPTAAKPNICRSACVLATGWHEVPRSYLGRPLGLRGVKARAVAIENERTR